MNSNAALAAYAEFFSALTPARLDGLEHLFAPTARFKDPFNDVQGIAGIRRVFEHMYDTLQEPRFTVLGQAGEEHIGYLHWRFDFVSNGERRAITGMSRVVFDADGRVVEHTDYWDPAEQLYAGIPVLGTVLRWLRRRLSAER
jgi:steroid delta-isomerase